MKELEKQIRKNGFDYTQIKKTARAYIYAQHMQGSSAPIAFEVFERRENKAYTIAGNEFPEAVAFPSNESFGSWAFVYRNLEDALVKFQELDSKEKKPAEPAAAN